MGTKLAPALATIYIRHIEEPFLESRDIKPMLWVRYIDDVFLIWTYTLAEFETFLEELNGLRERINFTAEISMQAINLQDLTIYKPPSFHESGILSTKIYYKPTNMFAYPLSSSYMPGYIHKGIAIGEMTRLIRNTTSPVLCNIYKRKLIKHL